MKSAVYLKNFRELIARKYQIYNGLFLDLPFDQLEDTGANLFFFVKRCEEGLTAGKSPLQITDQFLQEVAPGGEFNRQANYLFQILQFVERQVVLFDALEDAAFDQVNDTNASGTLTSFFGMADAQFGKDKVRQELASYRVRVVLTAHPTQFYPQAVLGIIQDLGHAINANDLNQIHDLLLQMGKTSFRNHQKPTPLDEARALVWYLENIFYEALPLIQSKIDDYAGTSSDTLEIGFWPGGDRDGNPHVTAQITREVGQLLKASILNLYREEIEKLKRRLTFGGVIEKLAKIESKLKADLVCDAGEYTEYNCSQDLLAELEEVKALLVNNHQSLFLDLLDQFIFRVRTFGFHFAVLDLRQDSRIHGQVLAEVLGETFPGTQEEKFDRLTSLLESNPSPFSDISQFTLPAQETLESLRVATEIQKSNSTRALHRYVISNTQGAFNVLEVMLLAKLSGIEVGSLDIVPLFETIGDLQKAPLVMETLYQHPIYGQHLTQRKKTQTIMLGFSDGTKDGGYLAANWAIYRAKEELSKVSARHDVKVVFFDGRGGPPSRGGGNTHLFYKSLSPEILLPEIHLTVQGQTISSKFGTIDSAGYNLEQLITAGLEKNLNPGEGIIEPEHLNLMEDLAKGALKAYLQLKHDPRFLAYLEKVTPLNYYGELNIGSRPAKRKASSSLVFEDLRAIPFVGAWTQMKQNVPGYYGLGTALKEELPQLERLREFYRKSLFFRTLLGNAAQSLLKSFFPLTSYLQSDPEFGAFWQKVYQEARLTEEMILLVSQATELMDDSPVTKESIRLRERIILPLLVIQHSAMQAKRQGDRHSVEENQILDKLIIKSLAANINASRNSV